MNLAARLKETLTAEESPTVSGNWRPISMCLDDTACEFLNVGVVFAHGSHVEVRMLDSFERLKCLYDTRINQSHLQHLLMDIEACLISTKGDLPDCLSDTIRLGPSLFAQGEDAESIVDAFFEDVVTLARPRKNQAPSQFRYRSSSKVCTSVIELMKERLGFSASRVIQDQPLRLPLSNGKTIDVEVPLLSSSAVGSVISAWYKSPMVVENNILQAGADLSLVASNSQRQAAMSVLIPNDKSGLTIKEREQVEKAIYRRLERFERSGITVLRDDSTAGLAEQTTQWWSKRGAA
ncbi:hypothetical protein CZ787_17220 [Halomonas citrativorans]|uniref:DUF3037 domain-containing protein n=1 Tax=Halomonas citrativorans TaxID=2742612 RepID=A0A1R4I4W5_9GAMM|nr:hypothetical protein [Halomonas citrativorans]SJN14852.1 hypothetical protein CZ787_17220 [Halomonas citrativorans]